MQKENQRKQEYFEIEYNLQPPKGSFEQNQDEYKQYVSQLNNFYVNQFNTIQNNKNLYRMINKIKYSIENLKDGTCAILSMDRIWDYKDILQKMHCDRTIKEEKLKSVRYLEGELKDKPSLKLRIIKYGQHHNSKTTKMFQFILLHFIAIQQDESNNMKDVNNVKKGQLLQDQAEDQPSQLSQNDIQYNKISLNQDFTQQKVNQEQKRPNPNDFQQQLYKKVKMEKFEYEEIPQKNISVENEKQQNLPQTQKKQQSITTFFSQKIKNYEQKELNTNQSLIIKEIQNQEKQSIQSKENEQLISSKNQEDIQKKLELEKEQEELKIFQELEYRRTIAFFDMEIESLKKQKQEFIEVYGKQFNNVNKSNQEITIEKNQITRNS